MTPENRWIPLPIEEGYRPTSNGKADKLGYQPAPNAPKSPPPKPPKWESAIQPPKPSTPKSVK